METVTNAAAAASNAASKLIWGDGAQAEERTATNETGGIEPASGLQGKGTATEPFDRGNSETPITDTTHSTTTDSTTTPSTSTTNPTSASAINPPRPEHETDKTGVTGGMSQSSTTGSSGAPSSSTAHTSAPEASAAPAPKQQGAANPTETPSVDKLNIDDIDGEESLKKKDPNDHSGEPMHMHGASEKKPTKIEERRESKLGQEGGQEHGKEEHGTGEQWVKSTGLAAEGGDFDATKPGAGREADRLQEEKGIHKESPAAATEETSPAPASSTGKISTKDKIKAKLHIGQKEKA